MSRWGADRRSMSREERRRTEVLTHTVREPYVHPQTVAAIQTVFNRTRLSHRAWESRQYSGRLDSRQAWRSDARGATDIFRDRRLPSATVLNVALLVDASGSMSGERACRAQDMAATLVAAFQRIATVNVSVWQHNASDHTTVYRNYERGSANKLNMMLLNINGGNADGFALDFVGKRLLTAKRPDERSLVIVISDGLPSVRASGSVAQMAATRTGSDLTDHSNLVASQLRAKGCDVMSVAIAGDPASHDLMYGKGNVVPFTGDWSELARSFATVFGKVLAKGSK
jgi:cobalamin biosynthesis protein CobT